jgi:alkanesulfonate monooxygenase SsuD/methylene tetrahydromethanopterin reductase-like flavin-dependent oxidoreductase (luciferase family)
MVGVNAFAADTDAEARHLITSLQQQFVSLRRGTPGSLPPSVDNMDELWSPLERQGVEEALTYSVVGAPDLVERALEAIIAETGANELTTMRRDSALSKSRPKSADATTPVSRHPCCDRMLPPPEYP